MINGVARRCRGLKALVNAMAVSYASVRSEAEIATDVRHRIANDIWLDGDKLVVQLSRHERTSAFLTAGLW